MTRIRSVSEVVKYFKEKDPNTQLTNATIRRLIADGTIPVIKVGVKCLVNLDLVESMFSETNLSKFGSDYVVNKS